VLLEVFEPLSNQAERIFQHENHTPTNQERVVSKQDLPLYLPLLFWEVRVLIDYQNLFLSISYLWMMVASVGSLSQTHRAIEKSRFSVTVTAIFSYY
jgi:hypothetical protein